MNRKRRYHDAYRYQGVLQIADADVLVKGVDEPNSCIIVEFGKRMRLLNFVVIFDTNAIRSVNIDVGKRNFRKENCPKMEYLRKNRNFKWD